ncbi:hypothetical protein QYF36_016580 [Acer negundo]|nr:hypothetical protein QYF36_014603 [Acer negundo]KAK4838810.1 hypothetical protein QYF36_016580 [Acer negundo]
MNNRISFSDPSLSTGRVNIAYYQLPVSFLLALLLLAQSSYGICLQQLTAGTYQTKITGTRPSSRSEARPLRSGALGVESSDHRKQFYLLVISYRVRDKEQVVLQLPALIPESH